MFLKLTSSFSDPRVKRWTRVMGGVIRGQTVTVPAWSGSISSSGALRKLTTWGCNSASRSLSDNNGMTTGNKYILTLFYCGFGEKIGLQKTNFNQSEVSKSLCRYNRLSGIMWIFCWTFLCLNILNSFPFSTSLKIAHWIF